MCGIVGFLDLSRGVSDDALRAAAVSMADALRHRGPDDAGSWTDAAAGVALGHRRLSIIDLSPEGHQPKVSVCGRFVVSFNGEIYNFKLLRAELSALGHSFRGHSDTEVMLEAFSRWGVPEAVQRFNGMFAFAVWDRKERTLQLARDRMGEKPLYFGWMGRAFLFASELKALRAHPGFRAEIDRDALALYLRHNYVPAPHSIYRGVSKLLPGTLLTIATGNGVNHPAPIPYWSARESMESGLEHPFPGGPEDAIAETDALLRDAVKLRMEADVPLGAFLSGGIDSSTVVALMQAQSGRAVKTFSIGFHEPGYDEAGHAKQVARHLGTDHTELYVTPEQAQAVIPRLPFIYDEPFSDSSQIPTFLVSELARRHVTVSLSGDGGDELFCGYPRYALGARLWKATRRIPAPVRRFVAGAITSTSRRLRNGATVLSRPKHHRFGSGGFGKKLVRGAQLLALDSAPALYLQLVSHWGGDGPLVLGGTVPETQWSDCTKWPAVGGFQDFMMYLDSVTYLPDDILAKVDRASMSVGLEARVPLLDHRLVELAWRIPFSLKVHKGTDKWILRQILYSYVPRAMVERPKMGFGVPIDSWLRGPICDWAEHFLDERRLQREGLLDPRPIRAKWEEHLSGRGNWQYDLWTVLMLEAWLDSQSMSA